MLLLLQYLLYQSEGQSSERRKKEKAEEDAKYKKQAFDDALQWEVIKDDRSNNIVYMSGVTGEIRIGAHGSENWVVQDDGYGYPCFYNMGTNETVHEDPRFIHDTDLDLVATRNYVMDEMRFAMYFCKDYWDKYKKAVEQDKKTEVRLIVLQVLNSPKPKHLNSFLLRATALFKSSSVVDIPMNQTEKQEIEYARWLVARMHELAEQGSDIIALRKEHKKAAVTALTNQPVKMVACRFCGRESRRNLGESDVSYLILLSTDLSFYQIFAQPADIASSGKSARSLPGFLFLFYVFIIICHVNVWIISNYFVPFRNGDWEIN